MFSQASSMACKAKRATLGLLVLASMLLAAGAWANGTTIKFVPHASLRVLDPHWTSAYITRNHGYLVYDTLFSMDKDFVPRPQMVDKWTVSGDGLTYTFTLRKGLTWHDGAPVTTKDVVTSLRRWGARDPMGIKLLEFTKTLEPFNDATFTLALKEPFGLVLTALAKPSGQIPFIMPERVAKTDPQKQIEDYTGSGPFRFVKEEFQPGVRAVYAKFAGYVPRAEPPSNLAGGKVVNVDRVEWIYMPDSNIAIAALNSGEMDMFEAPPVDLLPLVKDNPKIKVQVIDPLGFQGALRFNHLHPPFNNPTARRALLYMVNQADVMRVVVGDPQFMRECAAIFICGTPFATKAGAEDIRQDFDKAKKLLAEGGYKGEKVVMLHPTDLHVLNMQVLATVPQLRKGGLNVEVQAMDWSTVLTRRMDKKAPAEGGWNLMITAGSGADLIFPLSHFHIVPLCEKGAFGWYCDPKMAQLQDQWSRTADPAKARGLMVEMQKEAYDTGAYVPLGEYQQPSALRGITGVVPAVVPVFWGLRKQ